jgi:hypothetical protein
LYNYFDEIVERLLFEKITIDYGSKKSKERHKKGARKNEKDQEEIRHRMESILWYTDKHCVQIILGVS